MIDIKSENKGENTELAIKISGSDKDIIDEAVAVMVNLPKQIKDISTPLFLRFLAELAESDMYGVAARPMREVDDNAEPVEG